MATWLKGGEVGQLNERNEMWYDMGILCPDAADGWVMREGFDRFDALMNTNYNLNMNMST